MIHTRILISLACIFFLVAGHATLGQQTPPAPSSPEVPHSPPRPPTPPDPSRSSLAYISDFFSFVGQDATGHVVFAFDSNRGREEETWQAEHLVLLLHDEHEGWQDIRGNGPYDNPHKQLRHPPDSPFFQFKGTPKTGMTIVSVKNDLTLHVPPITPHIQRQQDESYFAMGASLGTLTWNGRTLKGRVIHERLSMVNFNRLTHNYMDLWTESNGLYAFEEQSSNFLYFHTQATTNRLSALLGNLVGFGMFANQGAHLDNINLTVLNWTQAWGLYRWPRHWHGRWEGPQGPGSIDIQVSDVTVIANFILGGLAMGIIKGEIMYNGETRAVYGLAEILV